MKFIQYGSGVHFGDPNAYWGSPAYLLEPGDAGYVPDPRSASFPVRKTKTKNSMKEDYIRKAMLAFSQQLLTFKNNIAGYATALGLTAAEVTAQAADADRFAWEVAMNDICSNCADQWAAWLRISRNGGDGTVVSGPGAVTPPAPEPAAVAPNIEDRFRKLVAKAKASANYNTSIGELLGIEGAAITEPDYNTIAPVLKPKVDAAGVMVGWGWQGNSRFLSACELEVDRGDGQGYRFLTIDSTPNYLDTHALPATPTKWTYRAVYRRGDARVGQWSQPVTITVG
jgi:hypothetical protein